MRRARTNIFSAEAAAGATRGGPERARPRGGGAGRTGRRTLPRARARRRSRGRGTARPHRTQARDRAARRRGTLERRDRRAARDLSPHDRNHLYGRTPPHSRGSTGSPLPGRVPLPHRCERVASHASDDRKGRGPAARRCRRQTPAFPEVSDSLPAGAPCSRRSSKGGSDGGVTEDARFHARNASLCCDLMPTSRSQRAYDQHGDRALCCA